MTSDQLGWVALVIFIACIVAAFLEMTMLAWVMAAAGIALIVYAKLRA